MWCWLWLAPLRHPRPINLLRQQGLTRGSADQDFLLIPCLVGLRWMVHCILRGLRLHLFMKVLLCVTHHVDVIVLKLLGLRYLTVWMIPLATPRLRLSLLDEVLIHARLLARWIDPPYYILLSLTLTPCRWLLSDGQLLLILMILVTGDWHWWRNQIWDYCTTWFRRHISFLL